MDDSKRFRGHFAFSQIQLFTVIKSGKYCAPSGRKAEEWTTYWELIRGAIPTYKHSSSLLC
jgi:hypothetical protein